MVDMIDTFLQVLIWLQDKFFCLWMFTSDTHASEAHAVNTCEKSNRWKL